MAPGDLWDIFAWIKNEEACRQQQACGVLSWQR